MNHQILTLCRDIKKSQSVKRGSIQVGVVGLDAADSSAVGTGGTLCVEMGLYADISWESRCNIKINF